MSVYNRKMFKRNARNALNQQAGVPSFQSGGPVATVTPFMGKGAPIRLYSSPARRVGMTADGRPYTAPARGTNLSNAAEIELATKALEGGIGSLGVGEQAYQGMLMGGDRARLAAKPITDYLGDSILSSVVEGAAGVAGNIAGGIGGGTAAMITGDEPDPSTLGGRMAGMVPAEDYLESLGFNIMDQQGFANLQSATALGRPAGSPYTNPAGVTPTNKMPIPGGPTYPQMRLPDGQREYLRRQEEDVRAMGQGDPSGAVYFDEETGEYKPGLGPEIQEILDKEATERSDRMLIAKAQEQDLLKGSRYDDGTPDGAFPEDEPSSDASGDPSEEGTTGTQTTTAEPGTTAETSAEVYDDAILREARKANDASGLPKLETATDELDAAMQAGTQSPEDIKAEFLKLLPKYEEDPSVQGLNLAMMGFMIAGGKSANAMENIAEGMKKGLPAFIKSKEKKKAFEREVDLLASKYTVGRLEEDRKTGRQKNTYFATEAFTLPSGEKVEEGQIFRLNDAAFQLAEKQGLTKYLTSESNFGTQITANASVEKARLEAEGTNINDLYEKSTDVEIGGQKIRVRFPSAQGEAAGMVARPSGGQAAWDAFTAGYAENLDQIRFADKGVGSAIDLLDNGQALGSSGLIGKIVDATKAVVPEKYGTALGIDYSTLSDANQFEVLNRSLALQLAPVLLQESGKTISDADRARVAAALGFNVDQNGNILFENGIANAFKTEEEARRSLQEVQRVLRRNATKLHAEYGKAAKLFGMQGLPTETEGAAGFVFKEGGEGDDFDLEIIAG